MSTTMSIFDYSDYLQFIKSSMEHYKNNDPKWNVSRWAKAMGFDNVTALHLILGGQRRPGEKAIPKFSKYFSFSEKEDKYFRYLIKKDLTKNDLEISHYLDTQIRKLNNEDKSKQLTEAQFKVVAEWHHFALQQLISRGPVKNDSKAISKMLKFDVTPSQVTQALENLCELGVIKKVDDEFHNVEVALRTKHDIPSEALKQHHEQMMDNAKKSIRTIPVNERQIHGRTLVVTKENLQKASEMIRDFSDQFGVEIDAPKGDQVYQLNIQFFPLSEKL